MLLIQKTTTNTLTVTLNEKATTSLPYNWLFVFELEQSDVYTYPVYLTDTSLYPERYNEFSLEEGVDVTFKYTGDYKYQVYQMPDGGSTDTSLGRLVETGKARVKETSTPVPTFEATTTTDIYDSDAI
jgi:hypothetical protein